MGCKGVFVTRTCFRDANSNISATVKQELNCTYSARIEHLSWRAREKVSILVYDMHSWRRKGVNFRKGVKFSSGSTMLHFFFGVVDKSLVLVLPVPGNRLSLTSQIKTVSLSKQMIGEIFNSNNMF